MSRRGITISLILAVMAVGILVASRTGPRNGAGPPSIIFILVDTLRRDHLSCYGSDLRTPNIDALARDGQIFTSAVASFHQTTMSMGAVFTGRTPSIDWRERERALEWNGRTWCGLARLASDSGETACLPRAVETLGERMRAAGYTNIGVISNQLMYAPAGFERGFDDWLEVGIRYDPTLGRDVSWHEVAESHNAEKVNAAAFAALDRRPERPVFLYLHYVDVHDYVELDLTYDAAVQALDRNLGKLLDGLGERGVLDDAVIVLASDHGEKLDETHTPAAARGHIGNPSYEQVLQVPLIVSPAQFDDPGRLVRSQDLFALLIELASGERVPARDLEPDEVYLSEIAWQTYRRDGWKTLRKRSSGATYLFNLREDPEETQDVAADHGELVSTHVRRIDELMSELGAGDYQPGELTADDAERLRALGYLQ
jgi:arylsulfatase A-like enzyme